MLKSNLLVLCSLLCCAAPTACRGVTIKPLVSETFPAHQDPVCILLGAPPPGLGYQAIADIEVELNYYGGDRKAKRCLAKQARKIGAHAVLFAVLSNQMGAPAGRGKAARFDRGTHAPSACEWY